jgi:hypothetical protein
MLFTPIVKNAGIMGKWRNGGRMEGRHHGTKSFSSDAPVRHYTNACRSDYPAGNGAAANLLIHMGGLGDLCLSESTFLSFYRHFGTTIVATGRRAVLRLFDEYFARTASIEAREWLYLFSRDEPPCLWGTAILIGKDRNGSLRERLGLIAREVIFVDMYPVQQKVHVEEYQLAQVALRGITPAVREFRKKAGERIILYPELPLKKRKWPVKCFLELLHCLLQKGYDAVLMRPDDPNLSLPGARSFGPLEDIADFFSQGGLFCSNDSGMAHFASRCGLATITLFYDEDPIIWHPKGSRYVECGNSDPTVEEVARLIESELSSK